MHLSPTSKLGYLSFKPVSDPYLLKYGFNFHGVERYKRLQ